MHQERQNNHILLIYSMTYGIIVCFESSKHLLSCKMYQDPCSFASQGERPHMRFHLTALTSHVSANPLPTGPTQHKRFVHCIAWGAWRVPKDKRAIKLKRKITQEVKFYPCLFSHPFRMLDLFHFPGHLDHGL